MATEETMSNELENQEIAFISDAFLRLLGGRNVSVCMTCVFSVVNSIAEDLPTDGREYIMAALDKFKQHIGELPVNATQERRIDID